MKNELPGLLKSANYIFGRRFITPAAQEALAKANANPRDFLERHSKGDWGDVPPEDAQSNNEALHDNTRILSAYKVNDELTIWIITDAGWETTTILLPSDY